MFQYKACATNYKRIVMFLPTEQDKLFVILPLALAIFAKRGPDNFIAITDENNRNILRALNLENVSLFYKDKTMLYGENDFFEMEKRLQEQIWDLCLFLQENTSLPFLYLAKITRATYRMGIRQEFPFLNIAIKNASCSDSIYAHRSFLYKIFDIDSEKAEIESVNATRKNEKQNSRFKLSTSNTILLNLQPPINGEPWSDMEISMICRAFQPTWRLIAISASSEQLDIYAKTMEELDMRSNPVVLHSESVFSVLRQYPAIITLNSMHSNLFLNLSHIKVIMLEQSQDNEIPHNARLLKFGRDGNFYSLSKLVADFIK